MTRFKPIVLAIEDDDEFRKAIESILGRFGINPKTTSDPAEFMDQAAKLVPDLYLIDLQLGGETLNQGFELIRRLRQELKVTTPIVVVSGERQRSAIATALELGANDFILKPFDRALLASKLSRFFETEELDEHKTSFQALAGGRAPGRVSFKSQIVAVDELGLTIQSECLIPKGTVFKISSELFKQFFAAETTSHDCLMAVVSTSIDPASELYQMYAEFEGVDVDFLQALRRWLSQEKAT